jgi:hypothetical protein
MYLGTVVNFLHTPDLLMYSQEMTGAVRKAAQ